MEKLKFVLITIAMWIFAYLITFDPTGNNYLKNGIKVNAEISQITPRIRSGCDYECFYINDKGEKVSAELILNQFNGELGQVVEGYYLPEKPNTVWCKGKSGFMLVFTLIVDGLAILMTGLLIFSFVSSGKKESPNVPPSYAWDGNESYDMTSTADVKADPWGYNQTQTWDEKQAAKEARDEWSRQHVSRTYNERNDNNDSENENHWKDEEWSGNQEIKNRESSTGLKLRL